jgi:hypothetical protein
MSGAIPPLPKDAFMAWCLVKSTESNLPFTFTRTKQTVDMTRSQMQPGPSLATYFPKISFNISFLGLDRQSSRSSWGLATITEFGLPIPLTVSSPLLCQRFGGRAASIFRVDVRDYGEVATALLAGQRGSSCIIRGFHDLYSPPWKPRVMQNVLEFPLN